MAAVAAGADNVERRAGNRRWIGKLQHGAGEASHLVGCLAFGPQGDDEAGDLHGRRLAAHHLSHDPGGLVSGEVVVTQQ